MCLEKASRRAERLHHADTIVGNAKCDADGKEISYYDLQLAVYDKLRRRVDLPIGEGSYRAPYKVEVSVTNKGRKDMPQEEMVFGNDIFYTMNVGS